MQTLTQAYKQAIEDFQRIENQFNNSLDDELTDVLIHERYAISKRIAYLKRKIEETQRGVEVDKVI